MPKIRTENPSENTPGKPSDSKLPAQTQRWGHMHCLRRYRGPVMAVDHHGNSYVADSAGGPWTLDLRCDCGHTWTMLQSEFPGRRRLRSCGRPECPHSHTQAAKARARPREPKEYHGITMDVSIAERIRVYAGAHNLSFSTAINELLHQRFDAHDMVT